MADLRGEERGQILLLAAFALAVIFLGLAVVANSAIYTENVATRGESIDASAALEDRHAIEQAVGEAVAAANRHNQTGTYSTLESDVQDSVQDIENSAGLHAAREGIIVSTSLHSEEEGHRLVQSNNTTFESSDAGTVEADWLLASGVDRTRAFEIEVTDASTLDSLAGSPFTVNVTTAPTANWTMSVADGGVGEVVVEVEHDDPGIPDAECRVPDEEPITIDVTDATIDGEPCHALARANGYQMHYGAGVLAPYDVRFENGDNIKGNYSLVVTGGTPTPGNYGAHGGSGSQPYAFPAMYEAVVNLRYYAETVDYETRIRVAPGEPDA